MSKKMIIGLCIGLCTVTACVTAIVSVLVSTNQFYRSQLNAQNQGVITTSELPTATTDATIQNSKNNSTTEALTSTTTDTQLSEADKTTVETTTDNTSTTTETTETATEQTTSATTETPVAEITTAQTTNSSSATASTTSSYIGEAKAKEIALAHAGLSESDVTFARCKLDYDDGIAEYEVEFYSGNNEYDYDINATTGAILSYDYDMEYGSIPQGTTSTSTGYTVSIDEAKAISIALAHANLTESGVTGLRCKLDYDDGIAEYEVEWYVGRTEYEYTIHAGTGTILEFDVDRD